MPIGPRGARRPSALALATTVRRTSLAGTVLAALLACSAPRERLPSWHEPQTGMELVRLPAGTFVMGSPPGELGRESQERCHDVTLTRPFWIGRHEVTQGEWLAVMGWNPSRFQGDPRRPVERVDLLEVEEFLARLMAASPGERFRLPTEAEWEYACRAGGARSPMVERLRTPAEANFDGRDRRDGGPPGAFRGETLPVGSFAPNAWGLHDLLGNVWEWTADPYGPYPSGAVVDPRPRHDSGLHVIRGGGWSFGADSARCALRYTHRPIDAGPGLGFRIVREEPETRLNNP